MKLRSFKKTEGVWICEEWSFKYHITGKVFVLTRIGLAKFNFFAIISIHS